MRIAVGTDEQTHLCDVIVEYLRELGHEVELHGPLAGRDAPTDWPLVSAAVAERVAEGAVDEGIVMCWTGTGASIAANKVRGVRAALCADAETARGARVWNHANVLALSLRATPEAVAREIVDAWLATPYSDDRWNREQVARVAALEARNGAGSAAS